MMRIRASIVAALLAASTASRAADPPQPPEPKAPTATLEAGLVEKVTVQIIQLNVLAVDGDGRPVRDLRMDEIELFDGGRPRRLAFLEPAVPAARETPPAATSAPSAPAAPSAPPASPPSAAVPPGPGRWIVLFLDLYGSSMRTRLKGIDAAREFIRSKMAPSDRVMLVAFDGKVHLLQSFTGDRQRLLDACDASLAYAESATGFTTAIRDLMDNMGTCNPAASRTPPATAATCAQRYANEYESQMLREQNVYMKAVTMVVHAIASIPDVKSVYLISEGFPRSPASDASDAAESRIGPTGSRFLYARSREEIEERFDALTVAAALAKVSIFTLNPGGSSRMSAIGADVHAPLDSRIDPLQLDVYRRHQLNRQQSLAEIAQRTGGTTSQGLDLGVELARLVDLSAGLYAIGYYAEPDDRARAGNDVKIRILRKGVKAVTRKDVPLLEPAPPLGGELEVIPEACSESGRRAVVVRLRVDRSGLAFERVDKRRSANFSVSTRLLAEGGTTALYEEFRLFNVSNPVEGGEEPPVDPAIESTFIVPCVPLTVSVTATDGGSGARREFRASVGP